MVMDSMRRAGVAIDEDPGVVAFEAFVVGSRDRLARALVAHHGREIAQDALADAYAYAWANWERVRGLGNPVGYLFRMADRIGTRRAMAAGREFATDHLDQVLSIDDTSEPAIVALLSTLTPRQRGAVLLTHGYGWTFREAAEVLDVPLTTLTNDVNRGLKKLREQFRGERQ